MQRLLFLVLVSVMVLSCNKKSTSNSTENTTTAAPATQEQATPAAAPQTAPVTPGLPSITKEKMQDMFQNCTNVDFIFYDLPVSMSQDEKGAIANTLNFISTSPLPKATMDACKTPFGRVFFNSNGESMAEADFFYTSSCQFFIFYDGNKKVYGNLMTPQCVQFLGNIVNGLNQGGN